MSKSLVIAEKPSVAQDIVRALTPVAGAFSNTGAFTARSGTVTMSAANGTKIVTAAPANGAFYNLTLGAGGGTATFSLGADVDVDNNLTIAGGTLSPGSRTINLGGTWTNNGIFSAGTSTVVFDKTSGTQQLDTGGTGDNNDFYNLTVSAETLQLITSDIAIDATLTVSAAKTFDLNSRSLTAATLVNNGTLQLTGIETVAISNMDTDSGTVTYTGSGTYTGLAAGDAYYSLTFNGTGGTWVLDAPLYVDGDLTITAGTLGVSTSNHAVAVAGSWTNDGVFTARAGTVTFNATGTGKTVAAGASSFYNVVYSGTGGWTISENLTALNDLTLSSCASSGGFIVPSGVTVTVNGTFSNSVGGSATGWDSGSVLALTRTGGGRYAINSRTGTGDVYGTLWVGADTDIGMWSSSATTYSINATGRRPPRLRKMSCSSSVYSSGLPAA